MAKHVVYATTARSTFALLLKRSFRSLLIGEFSRFFFFLFSKLGSGGAELNKFRSNRSELGDGKLVACVCTGHLVRPLAVASNLRGFAVLATCCYFCPIAPVPFRDDTKTNDFSVIFFHLWAT